MTVRPVPHQLENGIRTTTPPGDNLLLDFERAQADACAAIARAGGGRISDLGELGLVMTDTGSACPFGNVAHLYHPAGGERTGAVVAALRAFYAGTPGGPFLVFSAWPTDDLSGSGFALGGHPPLMVRPPAPAPTPPESLRIERVTSESQLADFERTLVEAFPVEELSPFGSRPRLLAPGVLDSNWVLYVGYEDDRAVATAGAYVADRVVTVDLVSTRDECRGRGHGAAITAAAATSAATSAADRPSMLLSSDPGRSVYERLGFLPVLRYTLWVGQR